MTLLLLLNIIDFDDHSTSEKNGHTLDTCVDVFSVCVGQADLYNVRKPLTQFLGVAQSSWNCRVLESVVVFDFFVEHVK